MTGDRPHNPDSRHDVDARSDGDPAGLNTASPTSGWPEVGTQTVVYHVTAKSWRDETTPIQIAAVVPPELADWPIRLPPGTAERVAAAERALSTLDTNVQHVPNALLEAASFALLRAESVSSSRIEGLEVSNRRLAEALHDPVAAKQIAREVADNTSALKHAIDIGAIRQPLAVEDICDVHRYLMAHVPGVEGGRLRDVQNWIGTGPTPADAVYVPPPPSEVPRLMDDLARLANRTDLPPAALAGITHAQFEGIHPFVDGNGRVGRCLVSILLRRHTTTSVIPPISGVFVSDTRAYFHALQRFQQEGDPWPWVDQFSQATISACEKAHDLTHDITALQAHWMDRAGKPRRGSISARLIEVLPTMSMTDANAVAKRLDIHPTVARRGLNHLEAADILSTVAGRKRNRVWRADKFHELLDHYSIGFSRDDI